MFDLLFSLSEKEMKSGVQVVKMAQVMTQVFVLLFLLQGVCSRTSRYVVVTSMTFYKKKIEGKIIIVFCLIESLHFLIIYSSCYRNKSNIAKPGQNVASPPVTLKKIGRNQVRSKFLFHLLIVGLNMLLENFIEMF